MACFQSNMFILEVFWPFLRVSSIFGLFPCNLKVDPETGVNRLQPIKRCTGLTRYFIFNLIYSSLWFSLWYIPDLKSFSKTVNTGVTDHVSQFGLGVASFLLLHVFCKHSWNIRFDLAKAQDYFHQNSPATSCKEIKRYYYNFIGYITLFFIGLNLGYAGWATAWSHYTYFTQTDYLIPIIGTTIGYGAFGFISIWPLMIFQLVFYNITTKLFLWIMEVRKDSKFNQLDESLKLFHAVTLCKEMFSGYLFTFTFSTLVYIISTSYYSLSLIMDKSSLDQFHATSIAIGFSLHIVTYCFIFVNQNTQV